jgi:predicted enzyme related to lactoylglutathione lyase
LGQQSTLSKSRSGAVLRAEDLARAKRFYEESLGLDVEETHPGSEELRVHAGGGTIICVYLRPQMPPPANTTACFEVVDIESTVEELRGRGVVFEEYDIPEVGLKTIGGIAHRGADKRAWFRDSEGNVLVVRQV